MNRTRLPTYPGPREQTPLVNGNGNSVASQHSLVTRILTEPGAVTHTWTHEPPTRGVAAVIATFRGLAP